MSEAKLDIPDNLKENEIENVKAALKAYIIMKCADSADQIISSALSDEKFRMICFSLQINVELELAKIFRDVFDHKVKQLEEETQNGQF